jgi:hypothetical protein
MENKHTPTPPKDEAIFPIKVNAKPNSKDAIKLAQSIMVKLAEKKEMENNTANRMKTAEEVLAEKFEASEDYPLQLCITLNPSKSLILEAMENYATQQTADLSTKLAKANSDKEKLAELLKEYKLVMEDFGDYSSMVRITECLTDCGITL